MREERINREGVICFEILKLMKNLFHHVIHKLTIILKSNILRIIRFLNDKTGINGGFELEAIISVNIQASFHLIAVVIYVKIRLLFYKNNKTHSVQLL